MKIKNNLWFLLLALSLSTASCQLDLDLSPTDRITVAEFFKTSDDFRIYASGLYDQLADINRKSLDNWTDIAHSSANAISRGSATQAPLTSGYWTNPYINLRRSFNLLKGAAKSEGKALGSAIDSYVGEAHFFIAYQYYNLLRYYGGVPLVKKVLKVKENHYLPRAKRADVVDYIMEHLDKAIAKLPASDGSGRLVKDAARAFKARVALFEGTWRKFHGLGDENTMLEKAIAESKAVIDGGKYALFKQDNIKDTDGNFDPVANFYYFFTLENYLKTNIWGVNKSNNKEFIITVRHDREENSVPNSVAVSRSNSYTHAFVRQILDSKGIPIDNAASVFQTDKANHGYGLKMITDAKGRKVANNIEFNDRDPRMSAMIAKPMKQIWLNRGTYARDLAKAKERFDGKEDAEKNTGIFYFQFLETPTGYLNIKFNAETRSSKGEQRSGIDFGLLRLAEVYLIYAEAKYERNGDISDADLDYSLNKLRDRVSMPKLTKAHVTTYKLNMQEEIRRERMVELATEGFRYDDIRRWKIAENVLPKDIKGIQWRDSPLNVAEVVYFDHEKWKENKNTNLGKQKFNLDADGFIIVDPIKDRKFNPARDYLWGVPSNEIHLYEDKGKTLTQNPNWTTPKKKN